jgi:hypothetical protein
MHKTNLAELTLLCTIHSFKRKNDYQNSSYQRDLLREQSELELNSQIITNDADEFYLFLNMFRTGTKELNWNLVVPIYEQMWYGIWTYKQYGKN